MVSLDRRIAEELLVHRCLSMLNQCGVQMTLRNGAVAKPLNEEIAALAAYFSSLGIAINCNLQSGGYHGRTDKTPNSDFSPEAVRQALVRFRPICKQPEQKPRVVGDTGGRCGEAARRRANFIAQGISDGCKIEE